jgi:hypothetical protein
MGDLLSEKEYKEFLQFARKEASALIASLYTDFPEMGSDRFVVNSTRYMEWLFSRATSYSDYRKRMAYWLNKVHNTNADSIEIELIERLSEMSFVRLQTGLSFFMMLETLSSLSERISRLLSPTNALYEGEARGLLARTPSPPKPLIRDLYDGMVLKFLVKRMIDSKLESVKDDLRRERLRRSILERIRF